MRQLIAVVLFCAGLFCIAQAQVPMTGAGLGAPPSGFSASCSQSSAWLARATLVTVTADKTAYDTMICGMVTDGTWALLDAFYVWAAPDSTTAQLNLVSSSFSGTPSGTSGGFTAHQGITGSSSGSYLIDTGFNPTSASSPNYQQNSATIGVYVQTNRASLGNFNQYGSGGTNTDGNLYQFGSFNADINSNTLITSANSGGVQGSWNVTRTTSSQELIYQNSNETAITTQADTSVSVPNSDIIFFAFSSGATDATTDQMSAGWIGGGVTAKQSCQINNRINTFLAGYSFNVYTNSAC